MKICTQCGDDKPLEDYYNNTRSADGKSAYCISCDKRAKADYYQRTKERAKARAARWAQDNPDKVRLAKKEWKRRNPDSNRKYKLDRRAREKHNHFTETEWKDLLKTYGGVCLCCGTSENLSADHVVPLALAGSNSIENIQPLCIPCNSRKGKKVIDYREVFRTT